MRSPTRGLLSASFTFALVMASAPGCKPSITTDTYFCGPEMLCPPLLSCHLGPTQSDDDRERATFAYNCVTSRAAEDFRCPEETADQEPDNDLSTALDLMTVSCGSQVAQSDWGCIDTSTDVDHFRFTLADVCVGTAPRFEANLSYPIGTAPLAMDLLDATGMVVASGDLCTSATDDGGTEERCIEEVGLPLGEYVLRIQLDPDGNADCAGACGFNRYQLRLSTPVS